MVVEVVVDEMLEVAEVVGMVLESELVQVPKFVVDEFGTLVVEEVVEFERLEPVAVVGFVAQMEVSSVEEVVVAEFELELVVEAEVLLAVVLLQEEVEGILVEFVEEVVVLEQMFELQVEVVQVVEEGEDEEY
jgi:hypothetical protein